MADYYNKTRGPLSLMLNDGTSCSLPPKSWIFVAPGNESSASILKLLSKGLLVKSAIASADPVVAAVVAPSVSAPPLAEVAHEVVRDPAPSAPSGTSAMREEFTKKKR